MKKVIMSKNEIMKNYGYSEEEFKEYFGDNCMGSVLFEDKFGDEVDVSIMENGKYVYMNMGMEWEFDSLREFEKWYGMVV